MKATIEFDLPEDECQFRLASTAMDWALTVFYLDEELGDIIKRCGDDKTVEEAVQHIRNQLFETMQQRGISLDMIE